MGKGHNQTSKAERLKFPKQTKETRSGALSSDKDNIVRTRGNLSWPAIVPLQGVEKHQKIDEVRAEGLVHVRIQAARHRRVRIEVLRDELHRGQLGGDPHRLEAVPPD
jgi:hypothetical protein